MRIEVAGLSHVGMKRTHNEDSFLLMQEENLYCVADGMGGHSSGEVASRVAVEEIAGFYRLTSQDAEVTWPFRMDSARSYDENRLATAIKVANVRILERAAQDRRLERMGTTVACLCVAENEAVVAHVGDSRVYCLRAGVLRQLTEDHSLLNDMLKARKMTQEEIDTFPHKNVIVRALGMKDVVDVDIGRMEPRPGDLFLLCSDGLSGLVSDVRIREVLLQTPNLQRAAARLIELANAAGGTDNVTCVLARVHAA
ncbi:MAG: Stp1/IreP family PP2C-type Ser/Thr phosphatase [Myxococcaceae bacterium]|nr:Stp1/IreP family PP2C-type Ser/Thr phosphatase [Myxococcaceae bacterium]